MILPRRTDIAAVNELDAQLIQALKKDHPHVSVETV